MSSRENSSYASLAFFALISLPRISSVPKSGEKKDSLSHRDAQDCTGTGILRRERSAVISLPSLRRSGVHEGFYIVFTSEPKPSSFAKRRTREERSPLPEEESGIGRYGRGEPPPRMQEQRNEKTVAVFRICALFRLAS